MTDQAFVQAILNSPEAPPASGNGNGDNNDVMAHALSLNNALSNADSSALPQLSQTDYVSERFYNLEEHKSSTTGPKSDFVLQEERRVWTATPDDATPSPPREEAGQNSKEAADDVDTCPGLEKKECVAVSSPNGGAPTTPTKAVRFPTPPSAPAPLPPPKPPAARLEGTTAAKQADEQAFATAARAQDVAASLSGLPTVRPRWQHNYLKMLLVGDSGVGKTTFVRNLFAAYAADVDFPVADASCRGATKMFRDSPERLCTEMVLKDDIQQVWWHYLVQDTPGYGDFDGPEDAETQRGAVIDYIRTSSQRYYEQETSAERASALHDVPDSRVDVCLYFLPPHRLHATDLRFMKELSRHVPIIPVLAKADAMTPEELGEFKKAVRSATRRFTGETGWRFSEESLDGAGAHQGPPFAVVASGTVDRSVARFWPVRRYPWGSAEPLLSAHSQLPALRRLLFESGYWELKAHTEKEYLRFRKGRCADDAHLVPRPLRPLARLLGGVAAVVAVTFIAVNAAPLVKSEVVRKEAARRVKAKVGEVVDSAVDVAHGLQGRVDEATAAARDSVTSAAESGKRAARKVAAKLETDEVRLAREAAERKAVSPKRWWKFWGYE